MQNAQLEFVSELPKLYAPDSVPLINHVLELLDKGHCVTTGKNAASGQNEVLVKDGDDTFMIFPSSDKSLLVEHKIGGTVVESDKVVEGKVSEQVKYKDGKPGEALEYDKTGRLTAETTLDLKTAHYNKFHTEVYDQQGDAVCDWFQKQSTGDADHLELPKQLKAVDRSKPSPNPGAVNNPLIKEYSDKNTA